MFFRNNSGEIFHIYSRYGRGLDIPVGTYNFLDLAPKGRDENGPAFSSATSRPLRWRRNRYKSVISATEIRLML
ncbi:MAG TPA: DUF899 family protein [Xanthobacteraceae bacterium]|nr:DUF899 family protein [Xanthobacteraceae bacterium]